VGLNALHHKYGAQGFTVLGFPCNQFGKQEPGGNAEEIRNGVRYVRPGNDTSIDFPIFEKGDVNGPKAHPMYKWLRDRCMAPQLEFEDKDRLYYSDMHVNDIRWNFEKFLVDHRGVPFKRYAPHVPPEDVEPDILALLARKSSSSSTTESSAVVKDPTLEGETLSNTTSTAAPATSTKKP